MKNEKISKVLKMILILLAIVLIVELLFLVIRMRENRKNTTYYTAIHSAVLNQNHVIAVGLSDFKYSEFYEYERPGYNKAVIWEYDENNQKIKEKKLDIGFEGVFTDIVKVKDGYIAIGYASMSKEQYENKETEGIIVKYNEDLTMSWRKNIHILDNTKLYSVIVDDQNRLVIAGESIYGDGYVGNHKNGGAILLRYSMDGKKLDSTNYGGPNSDSYHAVIATKDGYIAVGSLKGNTGFVQAYDKNLKAKWHYYSGYTDSLGLTSIIQKDNFYYITGSKLEEKNKTDQYQGILIKLNKNGKLEKEVSFKKEKISRLDNIYFINEKFYVLGVSGNKKNNSLENGAYLLKYNQNLELEKEISITEKNTTYTKILQKQEGLLLIGYSNAKIKDIKQSNGYDYFELLKDEKN